MKKILWALLLGATALFTACNPDDTTKEGGDEVPPSSRLEIAINENFLTSTSVTVYVYPEDKTEAYWFGILALSEVDAAGGVDNVVAAAIGSNPLLNSYKGVQGGTISGLTPATDYVAMAVCVDSRGTTGPVEHLQFRTLDPKPESDIVLAPIVAMLDYYGNAYGTGYKNYYLQLGARSGSSDVAVLCVDYLVAPTATSGVGTFEVDNSKSYASASIVGGGTGSMGVYGTYYALLDKDGNTKKMNFVTGGTMTISVEGDAYTIACDFTDVNGTKIKAEYSGVVEYSDLSSQMFAVPSVAAPYESLYSFSTAARLAKGSLRPFNL